MNRPPPSDSDILVVIPLYNHGRTVKDVVTRTLALGYQVCVVDDGSTDLGAGGLELPPGCLVVRHGKNRGKGAAIMTGAMEADRLGFEAIVTIDADGQHHPADIAALVRQGRRSWPSIVIGKRDMEAGGAPASSIFGRDFSNFWIRMECGREVADSQSGLRLYPVKELLWLRPRERGYGFEVEVLVRAAWAGIEINSVRVSVHYPDPSKRISHFKGLRDNARLSLLHARLVLRALAPWPHKRLVTDGKGLKVGRYLFHPIKLIKRLCMEHASPLLLATSAWTGLFLGALPLLACHTVVILYVCHRLHLNKVASVAASQFCCPPLVPVACIEVGYFLRHGDFITTLTWDSAVIQLPQRLWEWLLGSLVVGPVLATIGATLLYSSLILFKAAGRVPMEISEEDGQGR